MRVKTDPSGIWSEYQQGVQYKTALNLYDNVERNNNFFNDKQWEGVKAPDLDKPVFNILKPVVNYYIAMLISDDIAVNVEVNRGVAGVIDMTRQTPYSQMTPEPPQMPPVLPAVQLPGARLGVSTQTFGMDEIVPKVISAEVEQVLESANVKYKNRRMIRNCAVDGDACFYMWFDPDAETGFDYTGAIKVDLIDNTNVYFGNPSEQDAQEQPYIIIAYRRLTEEVREEAKANGQPADEITADDDTNYMNADKDTDNRYTTVLLKLWKEEGRVHAMKCTEKALVKKAVDTEYKLYPLAWMSWDSEKNSYHGVSPITGKINNQIFINKMYALSMRFVANHAFPKIVYDRTKLPNGWSNDVNKAIGVAGDPNTAILSGFKPPEMSADAMNVAQSTMQQTKELMGASDAALGNVKPDNTSAIVAVQKAAGLPLDIQRMDFHNFVESYVRVFIEMMRVNYGVRNITITDEQGEKLQGEFDFSMLEGYALNLNIDIGAGSYWSELMQVQTLDNLMAQKILPDALTYLEAIPDGYIKDKQKIIDRIRQMPPVMDAAAAGAAPPAGMGMETAMPTPNVSIPAEAQLPVEGQMGPALPGADMPPVPPDMMAAPDMAASMGQGMEPVAAMPPAGELPLQGGTEALTEEEFMRILEKLLAIPPEEALAVIDQLPVSEEDRAALREAVMRAKGGGNG